MQTDQAIYQYLSTGPEAFRVLTDGIVLPGPYQFQSVTLKGIERRIDALFVPQGHDGPVYIVEFQAQQVGIIYSPKLVCMENTIRSKMYAEF